MKFKVKNEFGVDDELKVASLLDSIFVSIKIWYSMRPALFVRNYDPVSGRYILNYISS
jgi:hypothetical protein